jgi:hypothetical protein
VILELASFLGTSVGGKLFGLAGDWLAERRAHKRDEAEFQLRKDLAYKGQLKEHVAGLNEQNADGGYSPLQWVVAFVILCFGITYCAATLTCFFDDPTAQVFTKDPSENSRAISIFFGAIKYDLADNRVLAMSKAGLGFLMCYPLVFILSMVTTGDRPGKRF